MADTGEQQARSNSGSAVTRILGGAAAGALAGLLAGAVIGGVTTWSDLSPLAVSMATETNTVVVGEENHGDYVIQYTAQVTETSSFWTFIYGFFLGFGGAILGGAGGLLIGPLVGLAAAITVAMVAPHVRLSLPPIRLRITFGVFACTLIGALLLGLVGAIAGFVAAVLDDSQLSRLTARVGVPKLDGDRARVVVAIVVGAAAALLFGQPVLRGALAGLIVGAAAVGLARFAAERYRRVVFQSLVDLDKEVLVAMGAGAGAGLALWAVLLTILYATVGVDIHDSIRASVGESAGQSWIEEMVFAGGERLAGFVLRPGSALMIGAFTGFAVIRRRYPIVGQSIGLVVGVVLATQTKFVGDGLEFSPYVLYAIRGIVICCFVALGGFFDFVLYRLSRERALRTGASERAVSAIEQGREGGDAIPSGEPADEGTAAEPTIARPGAAPRRKSVAIAFALGFIAGPLGLFYTTWLGALIMIAVTGLLWSVTFGLALVLAPPICGAWNVIATKRWNRTLEQVNSA